MKMNKKNKVIICLLTIAVFLFCIIQFGIIPNNRAKEADYARKQTDALTHDISVIDNYVSPYIGDANNICGLFEVLPLNNVSMKLEINSEKCALTVNYLDTVWNIGEEKAYRDLVYNSVAAMAAIDNLSTITYNFSGASYYFERTGIENVFGSPLSELLQQDIWNKEVQEKLNDSHFVEQFFQ